MENLKIIVAAYEFLTKEELETINKREKVKYLPERGIIIGTHDAMGKLINDFPELNKYEDDYDFYDLKSIFENEFEDGYAEVETGSNVQIDARDVLSWLIDDIKEIESDILSSEKPEETLDKWIGIAISEIFQQKIADTIEKFLETNDTYYFNKKSL